MALLMAQSRMPVAEWQSRQRHDALSRWLDGDVDLPPPTISHPNSHKSDAYPTTTTADPCPTSTKTDARAVV